MDVLLGVVVVLWMALLPGATLLAPPIALLMHWRQRSLVAALLYAAAVSCLVLQVLALNANLDWADRTGGAGTMFAGWYWLVLAVLLAAASVAAILGRRREPAPGR
jgi:hypothetical protein